MHRPPLFSAGAFFEMRGENDMGKLYTLDGKLLTETPEIRIGEKVYPVDSRQKTVKKMRIFCMAVLPCGAWWL